MGFTKINHPHPDILLEFIDVLTELPPSQRHHRECLDERFYEAVTTMMPWMMYLAQNRCQSSLSKRREKGSSQVVMHGDRNLRLLHLA